MIEGKKVVTMVLAGGKGERLCPLTTERSKPSVPFAGNYRIIDFTLMNCVMSGLRNVHVLAQYQSFSLSSHIQDRWSFLSKELGERIETVPPKMRTPTGFYRGTADAIYRNLDILEDRRPDLVLVLSGDHVYRADYSRLLETHLRRGADVSVLSGDVEVDRARAFGVIRVDRDRWIRQFVEKPADPASYGHNGLCAINLGVYCFNTRFLVQRLVEDARRRTPHDFGKNVLPESLEQGRVLSVPFGEICPDPRPYWKDVGDVDTYFQCHQDLLEEPPRFQLSDPRWCKDSRFRRWAPARICMGEGSDRGWSLVCCGSEIGDARVIRSVISPQVRIEKNATVDRCLLMDGVTIGAGARIRKAIIDKGVSVPPDARIGHGSDSRRFAVSAGGVVVVGQGFHFPKPEEERDGEDALGIELPRRSPKLASRASENVRPPLSRQDLT